MAIGRGTREFARISALARLGVEAALVGRRGEGRRDPDYGFRTSQIVTLPSFNVSLDVLTMLPS